MPGRNPNLNILAYFSPIFHLFTILTSSFTISELKCVSHATFHPIMHPISFSHHFLHLIMNLISFLFYRFQPHILVGVAPIGFWCGTPSWLRRLGAISVLRVLSLLFIWCLRGLLVLSWCRPWPRGGGTLPTPFTTFHIVEREMTVTPSPFDGGLPLCQWWANGIFEVLTLF